MQISLTETTDRPDAPRRLSRLSAGLSLVVWSTLLCGGRLAAEEPIDFDRHIRPILSENCFHCHGPDGESREAGLRLDTRDGALAGQALVPGNAADSELVRRLRSTDPAERMPPPDSNRRLTAAQIELLARWIDGGAVWSEHWAFVKPVRPAVPQVEEPAGAPFNPIDAFIQHRLQREGLRPSPQADRARLLRRVTLDLTGLPPTLEELDAYLADDSPMAYERAVERLLASPRYGERMVWDWLDAARYADTNGYQGDPTRTMWYWRDWATAAINANMPFDQFSIEQLAGDRLPQPTQEQMIATGFHRNHMINGEGGRIAEESRVDYVFDRVETTGTVWLGLTFNCCRCHDHKYDTLSQREYYQLSAYFNSIDETGAGRGMENPLLSITTAAQTARLQALRDAEQQARAALTRTEQAVLRAQSDWEATVSAVLASGRQASNLNWQPFAAESLVAKAGSQLSTADEAVVVVDGDNPANEVFTLTGKSPVGTITALRLEALPDERLVNRGPGRADNGNFVLTGLTLDVAGRAVPLEPLRADFEQRGWPAANVVDGKPTTGWAILPEFGKPHELLLALKSPVVVAEGDAVTIRLAFESPHAQHVLGRFRLSLTAALPELVRGLPDAVTSAIGNPADARTADEQKALREFYLSVQPEVTTARAAAEKATADRDSYDKSLPRTMVMRERTQPRETFILVRGAYDKYGEPVTHGVPAALPSLPENAPPDRLALAQWLMSPDHPLTARVVVNRMWQSLFGIGLVKTVDDFGVQGERPSHPELLDWLAVEFIESGWDVKHMQRLMVTSGAYRQSSQVDSTLLERDPENRLLARGPRYRWPSWMLRDQALAVSGLLQEHLGGPPVRGYQPEGIWEEATFGKIRYQQDSGPALHRRSLYQFWRRIVGPTVFFDVSARQFCTVNVPRTNTPLQALVTLNDVTYLEAARKLAERIVRDGGNSAAERLSFAYRLVLSRPANDRELALLLPRLKQLIDVYQSEPQSAAELLKVGESPADSTLPAVEVAAWTSIASLLLNLDETLSKE